MLPPPPLGTAEKERRAGCRKEAAKEGMDRGGDPRHFPSALFSYVALENDLLSLSFPCSAGHSEA